jgi:hypothetical protein
LVEGRKGWAKDFILFWISLRSATCPVSDVVLEIVEIGAGGRILAIAGYTAKGIFENVMIQRVWTFYRT